MASPRLEGDPSGKGTGVPADMNSGSLIELADSRDNSPDDEMDDDSDYDDDKSHGTATDSLPMNMSQKRRADVAAFDQWIENNQGQLSEASRNCPARGDKRLVHGLVGGIARDLDKQRIITSPRDYQIELFEKAKQQNTIAVLDTGSGKTLIAALLLRWTIEKELEDQASGKQRRISFFLVDKVALVFQQHSMLECNLDHPIEKFCGEMVDHIWRKELWDKAFAENMVIVCTAEILYKCLHHSYIQMSQINLLIFDEAHHTKKNHPYARIIKDFYVQVEDQDRQPRILGMTASPVDAQVDVHRAAAELEGLLHSQISTIANPDFLLRTICKPKTELVLPYARLLSPWETDLYQSLKQLLDGHSLFKRPLVFSKDATSQLGPWCADRFWALYMREKDGPKLEAKIERNFLHNGPSNSNLENHLDQVREAKEVVKNFQPAPVAVDQRLLSSKVIELINILKDKFGDRDARPRCIVFVQQRWTAMMLADLFQQPGIEIPGLKVGVLVGVNPADSGETRVSFRDHVLTIVKLKKAELNCIFATSVAEEGLDIPDCNTIIRFDLYNTMIQYIQSRGRARHEDSQYIHMVEQGNGIHNRKVIQNKANEQTLRRFCESMPEDRRLTGNDFDMDYFLRKERQQRQYTVPSSGARLNYKSSLVCLANFVASLPHSPETILLADYMVTSAPDGFQCEVILPSESPVRSALGRPHSTKQVAKCAAAFEMCLQLIKGKYLDDHLQPVFTKKLPAMRNARLAIGSGSQSRYNMRIKPEIWSYLGVPQELYVAVLTLSKPESLGRPSRPLLLLTRQAIPQVARVPLFFGEDRSSDAHCVSIFRPIQADQDMLGCLTAFTLKIFEDIFSKEYENGVADLPYFLCPSKYGHDFNFSAHDDTRDFIDWDTLEYVAKTDKIKSLGDEPDEFFRDKFVVDPWNGSHKFFLRHRRHDLKPQDPVPASVVPLQRRGWKSTTQNIINYSVSLWTKSRTRATWKEDQPVVEAELLPIHRNFLDDTIDDQKFKAQQCFLILEPLQISPLPTDIVAMACTFPAIIHRIESNLIALDMCRVLGLPIRPDLALEAFTKDSDGAGDEHNPEEVTFQGGMGNNYERLELLGDSFLKMATTIAIFTLNPDHGEFEYHVSRMLLICNKNLFKHAIEMKLHEHIRSIPFCRRTWYPEGLTLKKGKRKAAKTSHVLAGKSIADVCEAVIGAAYLTTWEEGDFDMAVQAVATMVKDKYHPMTSWSDYYAAYNKPAWQTAQVTPLQDDMARRIAAKLGYTFKHPRLLRCAFMHPSYPSRSYEKLPSYQRLEFLGDALLDMVCVDHLFHRFPGADPQWLTEHKMAMVSNHFLGYLAVSLGFNKNLVTFDGAVQRDVHLYVTEVTGAQAQAQEDAVRAGRDAADFARDFWVRCSQPPKCLPDVLEAYVGAVFVDSGYDYGQVRRFFADHVQPHFADMRRYDTFASKHPVTLLGSLMQLRFHCEDWRLLVRDLPPGGGGGDGGAEGDLAAAGARSEAVVCGLRVHDTTLAHAVAASGRYAKIAAAKKAVAELEPMDPAEFRARFGCRCRAEEDGVAVAGAVAVADVHGSAI